jgi:hypothetical protein
MKNQIIAQVKASDRNIYLTIEDGHWYQLTIHKAWEISISTSFRPTTKTSQMLWFKNLLDWEMSFIHRNISFLRLIGISK